jgi:hypothetical protein
MNITNISRIILLSPKLLQDCLMSRTSVIYMYIQNYLNHLKWLNKLHRRNIKYFSDGSFSAQYLWPMTLAALTFKTYRYDFVHDWSKYMQQVYWQTQLIMYLMWCFKTVEKFQGHCHLGFFSLNGLLFFKYGDTVLQN